MQQSSSAHTTDRGVDAQAALESWVKVSRALVDDLPLSEILDVIAHVARDLTGNLYAMIALAGEHRDRLVVQGSAGLPEEYLAYTNVEHPLIIGSTPERAETPSSRAFRTGLPCEVLDATTAENLPEYQKVAEKQGYRGVLSIPLAGAGELGVLTVYAPTARKFEQSQIDLLTALAHCAAAAIEIVRLRGRELAMMAELKEVDLMHQRLTRLALAGTGLDPILRSLSEMTGYSMYVEDYVSGASIGAWPEGHLGPKLPASRREILRDQASQQFDLATWSPSSGRSVYVAPIVLAGEVAALLWASGEFPTMTGTQQRILERGALVSALELLKQRNAQEVAWRLRGDLFRDLMSVDASEEPLILERARTYGHDLARPHTVLVIRPDPSSEVIQGSKTPPSPEAALQHVIACTRSIAMSESGRSLVASHDGAVVMLLPHDRERADAPGKVAKTITTLVARGGSNVTASVMIGDVCEGPLDYQVATRAASVAVRMTQAAGGAGRAVDLADLGIYRLLLSAQDPAVLRAHSERILEPLRQHQDARSADLLNTLEAYVENDLKAGKTAQALHIHPNTLAYRLQRIESLTGAQLKSSPGILEVTFALAIDRLVRPQ